MYIPMRIRHIVLVALSILPLSAQVSGLLTHGGRVAFPSAVTKCLRRCGPESHGGRRHQSGALRQRRGPGPRGRRGMLGWVNLPMQIGDDRKALWKRPSTI